MLSRTLGSVLPERPMLTLAAGSSDRYLHMETYRISTAAKHPCPESIRPRRRWAPCQRNEEPLVRNFLGAYLRVQVHGIEAVLFDQAFQWRASG